MRFVDRVEPVDRVVAVAHAESRLAAKWIDHDQSSSCYATAQYIMLRQCYCRRSDRRWQRSDLVGRGSFALGATLAAERFEIEARARLRRQFFCADVNARLC